MGQNVELSALLSSGSSLSWFWNTLFLLRCRVPTQFSRTSVFEPELVGYKNCPTTMALFQQWIYKWKQNATILFVSSEMNAVSNSVFAQINYTEAQVPQTGLRCFILSDSKFGSLWGNIMSEGSLPLCMASDLHNAIFYPGKDKFWNFLFRWDRMG